LIPDTHEELREIIRTEVSAVVSETLADTGPKFLNTKTAAAYLGVSPQFLEIARHRGEGPAYSRLTRQIRYQRDDLDGWMNKRRLDPESV